VFYVTLGTGVGTAIVFDKRIHHGRTGNAGEGGHVSIDYRGPQCNCGKRGCIEVYCAGPGIARRARERLAAGAAGSQIAAMVNGKLDEVRAETVGEAHRRGDAVARELLEETADLLAVYIGNVVDLVEPDVFILGGGVSEILGEFLPRIRQRIPQWSINPRSGEIPIVPARYGTESGIAGAAALILAPQRNPQEE
jgi:glucokinase